VRGVSPDGLDRTEERLSWHEAVVVSDVLARAATARIGGWNQTRT